jgi:hypothetical protein
MARVTIDDLVSEFLILPKGDDFLEYPDFRDALELLKQGTTNFTIFNDRTVLDAVRANSRVFVVLRAILGLTPPEWAALARSERGADVGQGPVRTLDRACRGDPTYLQRIEARYLARLTRSGSDGDAPSIPRPKTLDRVEALIGVAVEFIARGAPPPVDGLLHRLAKFNTEYGLASLRHAANEAVPYATLLYERLLGRPFAGHRDAVSELVGEVMENAVEERLRTAGVTFRKTKRAERIPGYDQAPDFCVPDEISPAVVIEAKITSDDGTARDKVARIKTLAIQRDRHMASGRFRPYAVVACIDGRGFRERREDMRQLLTALDGKVFTTATLDHLIAHTRLNGFVSSPIA